MKDQPVHRLYLHFQELPLSIRVLYTAALLVLGLGYLFALIYVWASDAGRDGDASSLSVQDIEIAYGGSKKGSRLEAALKGPMSGMLPPSEISEIIAWVRRGSNESEYEKDIKPIMEKRCMLCHDGSNPHLPNLKGYENLHKTTALDTGTDLFTLVRVSHIHLFGLTFIFFIVGLIFSHAFIRPVWFKCTVMALPFVTIGIDVCSWYLTKLVPIFAWAVLVSGGVMALCFAFMWTISLYQMWFYTLPAQLAERSTGGPRVID